MLIPTAHFSSAPASGPCLWLQADNGVVDSSGIPCVDGGSVAGWKDQSGRGHHATVTGGSPVFNKNQVQGCPAVRVDGSGKAIVVPSGAFADIITAGYLFTLFIVFKPNSLMVTYTALSDSASRNISLWIGNGYWQCFNAAVGNYTSTWTTGVPQLLTYTPNLDCSEWHDVGEFCLNTNFWKFC